MIGGVLGFDGAASSFSTFMGLGNECCLLGRRMSAASSVAEKSVTSCG